MDPFPQLLVLQVLPICGFCFSLTLAGPIPPFSSPQSLPVSPKSPTVADFSPGGGIRSGEHRMGSNRKLAPIIIASSAALCAVVLSLLCLWIYHRKSSEKSHVKNTSKSDLERGPAMGPFLGHFNPTKQVGKKSSVSVIDYKLLETATSNFHESNVLGETGFGCLYKGQLDNDFHLAVKKLDGGGQDLEREYKNEVDLLRNFQHPNVISLLGYCIHEETRLLVYELMQNGSLETQLHGQSKGSTLTWHVRMKIALDTARGLEYLHEYCKPPVIHRDLKSSNILLDSNFNAKLSNFGLAVTDEAQNKNEIKLSGTLGYLAPEYLLHGKLTDKSDVYAFGVVLLELLLGKKPVEKVASAQCQSIVTWAMPQLTDRTKLPNILDPVIRNTMDLKHLYQVAAVAVLCVQQEPSYRPLITDVLHSLIPLVPVELGGTLRFSQTMPPTGKKTPPSEP